MTREDHPAARTAKTKSLGNNIDKTLYDWYMGICSWNKIEIHKDQLPLNHVLPICKYILVYGQIINDWGIDIQEHPKAVVGC